MEGPSDCVGNIQDVNILEQIHVAKNCEVPKTRIVAQKISQARDVVEMLSVH